MASTYKRFVSPVLCLHVLIAHVVIIGMSRGAARERILDDIAAEARARAVRLFNLQEQGDGGSMLVSEAFRML